MFLSKSVLEQKNANPVIAKVNMWSISIHTNKTHLVIKYYVIVIDNASKYKIKRQ